MTFKQRFFTWLFVKVYEFGTSPKRSKGFRDGWQRNLDPKMKSMYETIKLNRLR